MSENSNEPGHGNSVAAWTAVIVAIIGVTLVTFGYIARLDAITYSGAVITVLSIVIGPVLSKLGFGVAGKSHK
jgi:hypothetical protein